MICLFVYEIYIYNTHTQIFEQLFDVQKILWFIENHKIDCQNWWGIWYLIYLSSLLYILDIKPLSK